MEVKNKLEIFLTLHKKSIKRDLHISANTRDAERLKNHLSETQLCGEVKKFCYIYCNKFIVELQLIELLKIEPSELDAFLELGWFRIQQKIFTTQVLNFNGIIYSTVWLRVPLIDFQPGKKFETLSHKKRRFKTEIKKAIYTPEHEALYAAYRKEVSFESAPSLQWLLYGNSTRDVYNTFMINLYDGNKLIGAGFFDLGDTSAAGICSIYDPEYKKYSLGKYMIYEKIFSPK